MTNGNLRAGVVGLGTIGGGIAISLARRGRIPVVHDVRRDAAHDLQDVPAPLDSPAEVGRGSDVVFISVVDAAQVLEVVTGADGLLAGTHPGLVILVTATVPVALIRQLADDCSSRGATLLDCGLNRGARVAENGLLLFLGGPTEAIERVRPVLDDVAGEILHCGPLGTGMATKLACQVVTAGRSRAVHEAVELVTASGVDPATLLEGIVASDPDGSSLLRLQRLRMAKATEDEFGRPVAHFPRNLDKDMEAVQQLAADTGVAVPLVDLTRARIADTFAWIEESPDDPVMPAAGRPPPRGAE